MLQVFSIVRYEYKASLIYVKSLVVKSKVSTLRSLWIHNFWLIKILHICAVTEIIRRIALVGTL